MFYHHQKIDRHRLVLFSGLDRDRAEVCSTCAILTPPHTRWT